MCSTHTDATGGYHGWVLSEGVIGHHVPPIREAKVLPVVAALPGAARFGKSGAFGFNGSGPCIMLCLFKIRFHKRHRPTCASSWAVPQLQQDSSLHSSSVIFAPVWLAAPSCTASHAWHLRRHGGAMWAPGGRPRTDRPAMESVGISKVVECRSPRWHEA